jgi:hypothetical protein
MVILGVSKVFGSFAAIAPDTQVQALDDMVTPTRIAEPVDRLP